MADTEAQDAGNRAKVAQTLAEVRGLRDLFKAEISSVQRQLDSVTGLPVEVAMLKEALAALDKREKDSDADMDRRVAALEGNNRGDRNWRRSQLPIILLTVFLVLAGIAQVIVSFNSHP